MNINDMTLPEPLTFGIVLGESTRRRGNLEVFLPHSPAAAGNSLSEVYMFAVVKEGVTVKRGDFVNVKYVFNRGRATPYGDPDDYPEITFMEIISVIPK